MAFIYFKFTKTPLPSFGSCESGRILIRGEKELKGRGEGRKGSLGKIRKGYIGTKMSGRKETVLDLAKFVDKGVQVKLTGGRQVTGTLKGYDQLLNLVLDEAIEFLRDSDDPLKTTDQTRRLGLIVCRGTAVMLVSPTDGTDEIANPFGQPEGA
ncbi:hypothetical protein J5N97_000060 [Dioscorea zingiberensis]|uniref:Sm domain-containing protein n=1 Tax=Dioscorea zingiberensis TaxID=325984 RepID=A0A9D5H3F5_9LILI|nr:hypothetical protein J5N97_000060 [Dioscorea zingiberensis]